MNNQEIRDNILLDDDNHIIDIAASFNCEHQDDEYNKAYKKWRSDKNNAFAYNYVKDTREHTYLDGVGFINQNPAATEKNVLTKNMYAIGIALIIALLVDLFGQYIFVKIMSLCGCCVNFDFMNGFSNAPDCVIVFSQYFMKIFRLLIPILILYCLMKLPKTVMFPMKIINKDLFKISVPFVIVTSALCNFCLSLYNKLLSLFNIETNINGLFMPESLSLGISLIILNIIVIPILSELLLRGAILQSLRQFGDGFALLTTSIISAMMYHDVLNCFYVFIITIVIGYFVLRTGSVFTGILMHIAIVASIFLYSLLKYFHGPIEFTFIWSIIQFFGILIGFSILLIFLKNNKSLLILNMQKTFVSTKEKLLTSLISFPILAWTICVFIQTLMTIKFKD